MKNRRRLLGSMAALAAGSLWPLPAVALAEREPSRTAQATALQRAAHQLLERPLVFEDPMALRVLGAERVKWLGARLDRYETPAARAMRAFLVMRSRYAEDELARLYRQGVRQYIILGAGLDTFACRNPHGGALRVYEVDHPATQRWKRARLEEQGIALPRSLTWVPVDFETQSLADRLHAAGFRRDMPAFISWLGVTMYLSREAVMQTLRFVAGKCARGSEIVFDFSLPDDALGETERAARARRAERVAALGEPWISRFDSAALADDLAGMGFSRAVSFGADEANARYFAGRTDGFRLRGSGRMMTAVV